jgi:nucleotide-binding universal stress UspA family protein
MNSRIIKFYLISVILYNFIICYIYYKTLLNNDIYIVVMIQNPLEGNISDSWVNLNFPSYKKILVTHDGLEMSNKALLHAILLTKIANAELVIVNVIEEDIVPPSTLLSFLGKEGMGDLNQSKEELRNTLEGAVKKMLEEKIKEYKDLHINLSYKVLVGEPTDEIINYAEESDIDLMASRKITSIIRAIGSTVRKVIDNTRKPVLVIHE